MQSKMHQMTKCAKWKHNSLPSCTRWLYGCKDRAIIYLHLCSVTFVIQDYDSHCTWCRIEKKRISFKSDMLYLYTYCILESISWLIQTPSPSWIIVSQKCMLCIVWTCKNLELRIGIYGLQSYPFYCDI